MAENTGWVGESGDGPLDHTALTGRGARASSFIYKSTQARRKLVPLAALKPLAFGNRVPLKSGRQGGYSSGHPLHTPGPRAWSSPDPFSFGFGCPAVTLPRLQSWCAICSEVLNVYKTVLDGTIDGKA